MFRLVDAPKIGLRILGVLLFAFRVELCQFLANELSVRLAVLDAHPEDRLVSTSYGLVKDLRARAFQCVIISGDLNERHTRAKVFLQDLHRGGLEVVTVGESNLSLGDAFGIACRGLPGLWINARGYE